jgi:copper chaperone CopZ
MPTLRLRVPLASRADEARVEGALRAIAGVFAVVANREEDCVDVDFSDDQVAVADLTTLLADLGYEATLAG